MANPLRNAMVYLGLAEEDEQQYEQYPSKAQPAPAAARPEPAAERATPAPVTPIASSRPATPNRPVPVPTAAVPTAAEEELNEILTVAPKAYKDAQIIAEHFRKGVPVIINLSQIEDGEARRIIDFASGLSQGLSGKIERVTSRVFLLTPHHVAVHSERGGEGEGKEASFFA